MGVGNRWLINGTMIVLLCSAVAAQQSSPAGKIPLETILQAMQKAQGGTNPQASYQIIREYRLFGAKTAQADSEVVAEVDFKPPSSEGYTIQKYTGSGRGQQLVRSVLDHEVELASRGSKKDIAISSDNYSFHYIGEQMLDRQPCYVLGLTPKRSDKDLISGQVWVDQHSFRIRQIEGDVEKTPSWWLRKVHVKLVFGDLDGVWLQTRMEAVADVRIVGTHTLTSRILDYRRESEVAATPLPPSTLPHDRRRLR